MQKHGRITAEPLQAIVFDFDLTLADSTAGIEESINWALRQMKLATADAESIRRTIGLSLEEALRQLTGITDPAAAARFRRLFKERADQVMAPGTWIFPAVPPTLARLRAAGPKLGILSNKFRYRIEQVLQREGLRECFDTIVGFEDLRAAKPDPAGLLKAIEQLGVTRQAVLYVGDSLVDAETAERAGTAFVAVLSGTTTCEEFSGCQAAAILSDVGELPSLLGLDGCPGAATN